MSHFPTVADLQNAIVIILLTIGSNLSERRKYGSTDKNELSFIVRQITTQLSLYKRAVRDTMQSLLLLGLVTLALAGFSTAASDPRVRIALVSSEVCIQFAL